MDHERKPCVQLSRQPGETIVITTPEGAVLEVCLLDISRGRAVLRVRVPECTVVERGERYGMAR